MGKDNVQIQAALSLLQYHLANTPQATTLPEFKQVRQREIALLRSIMYNGNVDFAQKLYINSIAEFDEVLQDLTSGDLIRMRQDVERKALADDIWL